MAKCTGVRCPMQHGYKVNECNHTDCPYRTEPITNADRIRNMSDEELAEVLGMMANGNVFDLICDNPKRTIECDSKCINCIAEWLKQPAE